MKNIFSRLLSFALFLTLVAFTGCTKSGGGDDSDTTQGPGEEVADATLFRSECGAVLNGELVNPASTADMLYSDSVRAVSGNLLVFTFPQGEALVKLHAIGTPPSGRSAPAQRLLASLVSRGAYYLPAGDCRITTDGGGIASTGQVYSADGRNLAEELILSGIKVNIEGNGTCNERLVANCYVALAETVAPNFAGDITDFLWKPESDGGFNNGLLVVLVNPFRARVVVNGEELVDFGPSNGRGTTARSTTKSGCAFGNNVKVEVFDQASGNPYRFPDGGSVYTVPVGCNRTEFKF